MRNFVIKLKTGEELVISAHEFKYLSYNSRGQFALIGPDKSVVAMFEQQKMCCWFFQESRIAANQ